MPVSWSRGLGKAMAEMIACPECGRSGTVPCDYCSYGYVGPEQICNACAGTGLQSCPVCGGRGWVWDDEV